MKEPLDTMMLAFLAVVLIVVWTATFFGTAWR